MKYDRLTKDQQEAMLEARLARYEAEHYDHAVNEVLLVASGDTEQSTKDAIEQVRQAMATLDKAHAATLAELTKIKK